MSEDDRRRGPCSRDVGHIFGALFLVISTAALGGCSSSSTTGTGPTDGGGADSGGNKDAAAADGGGDAGSSCGSPGDVGNSLGVGKYCNVLSDCLDRPQAKVCATIGDPTQHFCTLLCTDPGDAGGDAGNPCGENATCQCQGGQCGCVPNKCL